jgi:hypothetical protein
MAGLGRKVFTAGDVLTASDVQNYLMDQTVMNFAGTAARSSAIATPTTGMTTYIGTTGTASIPQLEVYTGSAFQTPYGLTLVASATVSGAASVSINNVFTTAYPTYVIESNLQFTNATQASFKLRSAGTDNSTNYFYANFRLFHGGTTSNQVGGSQTSVLLGFGLGNMVMPFSLKVVNPALVEETTFYGDGLFVDDAATNFVNTQIAGVQYTNTAFDGFTIIGAGATGTVRVYGLRNS